MTDRQFMKRAITLAKRGHGWVHPNPMVGAVLVKDNKIIGEGWHKRCGDLHAERNAFADAKSKNNNTEGATLYVTLEPCCHYGRTAPCTEAIIENKIKKVVIGSNDPNPKVAGKGIAILRNAGIEVVENFMREECDALNPVFFHYITTKTPYVTFKYAMTLDGKIATKSGASRWISGEESRKEVHKLRYDNMAIMVGIGTVLADDPVLNCRLPKQKNPRNPIRIICDSNLRLPLTSNIVKTADSIRTIVATTSTDNEKVNTLKAHNVEVLHYTNLKQMMKQLGEMEIDSILLEGGPTLAASFLEEDLVNEMVVFVAPKLFGGKARGPVEGTGVELPDKAHRFKYVDMKKTGEDLMLRCLPE